MYFHASEFRGRLTFALLLEGNYVCSFLLVKWRGKILLCVCVCVWQSEGSNDFFKTKQRVSDQMLQIKYPMCTAQGFDY